MSLNPPFSTPFSVPNISVAGTSAAAQAVIDLMTDLAAGEANKIAASVDAGIAAGEFSFDSDTGLFSPVDAFFGLMLESETNKNQDWFVDRTGSFPNGQTNVSGKGASFNGTDEYFSPLDLTDLTNYAQDDGYISTYLYEQRDTAGMLFGVREGAIRTLLQDGASNSFRVNCTTTKTSVITFTSNSRCAIKRTAGTVSSVWKDGISITVSAIASVGVPGTNIALGAFNDRATVGSFYDVTASYMLFGGTEANNYDSFENEVISRWALTV